MAATLGQQEDCSAAAMPHQLLLPQWYSTSIHPQIRYCNRSSSSGQHQFNRSNGQEESLNLCHLVVAATKS